MWAAALGDRQRPHPEPVLRPGRTAHRPPHPHRRRKQPHLRLIGPTHHPEHRRPRTDHRLRRGGPPDPSSLEHRPEADPNLGPRRTSPRVAAHRAHRPGTPRAGVHLAPGRLPHLHRRGALHPRPDRPRHHRPGRRLERDLRLRPGRQPNPRDLAATTSRLRRRRPTHLYRHPHPHCRHRPLRTRRRRPHDPAPKVPRLPQTRHLALYLGPRGPPHGGRHPRRHPLALPVRPPRPPHRETSPRRQRRHRRGDPLHLARHHPHRAGRHLPRLARTPEPDLGLRRHQPDSPGPDHPLHPGRRRTPIRDRHPLPYDRHRPHRHPHPPRRRNRHDRLADPHHPVGHYHLEPGRHRLHPLRFPGQYHDLETGHHYNLHRHYDPETARYLTPDPLGLVPAPNPISYVHNPLTWSDPLGLTPNGGIEWIDPNKINFSQRTVSPNNYVEMMRSGGWDWSRPGTALKVIERDGQLISYDNRRLDAAREVGTPAAIERVDPHAVHPDSTTGRTWDEQFNRRMNSPRNRNSRGEPVPRTGMRERPTHVRNNPKRCR